MPFQLSLLLAVLALPGVQSASHRRSNLRLPASASSLIDSNPVVGSIPVAAVTTTALSVWPSEAIAGPGRMATTTAAPNQATIAPNVVPLTAAPGAVPLPTMGPVIPPVGAGAPPGAPLPPLSVAPAAPVAYAPPSMIVNASEPCHQINLTETLKQIQNAAHLSASAAQAALEGVEKAGRKPSLEASTAYGTALEAAGLWEGLLNSAGRTERTADAIDGAVKIYGKIGRKAAANYHAAVNNVRDFPPHIPAVQVDQHLAGLTRT